MRPYEAFLIAVVTRRTSLVFVASEGSVLSLSPAHVVKACELLRHQGQVFAFHVLLIASTSMDWFIMRYLGDAYSARLAEPRALRTGMNCLRSGS